MKTLSTAIASIIFAAGSVTAMAATQSGQPGEATQPGAVPQQESATQNRTGTGVGTERGEVMQERTGAAGETRGAQPGARERGMDQERTFSTLDRSGTNSLTRQEAAAGGISEREFDKMDEDGDGLVSQNEFQDFQDKQQDKEESDY